MALGSARDDDRRGFPRTGLTVLLEVKIAVPDAGSPSDPGAVNGLTADFSRGGCGAWVGKSIPESSRCTVRFHNTKGQVEPILATGVVRRVIQEEDACFIGVEFDNPLQFVVTPVGRPVEAVGDGTATVLVADDQPEVRDVIARFLQGRGFVVETAATVEEALDSIRDDPPDVLLLDIYIPSNGGQELLRAIRRERIGIRVICTISGYAADEDAQECLRLGAADHLAKPLDLDYLDWNLRLRLGAVREA